MFDCKDSEGTDLNIDDVVVLVEETPDGLPVSNEEGMPLECIIINKIDSEHVTINPINFGLPEIVDPIILKSKYSWLNAVKHLASDEELQEIIAKAKDDCNENLAKSTKKKTTKKKTNVISEVGLDL